MNYNENNTTSQCAKIRHWLQQGKKLTSLEALELFGCMRLASRICDLRKAGLDIHTEKVITHSGKIVTQYSLQQ